jgi:hypothetical protein
MGGMTTKTFHKQRTKLTAPPAFTA